MDRTHLVMHHLLRRSILTSPFIVREKTIHTDILILILFPASNKLELPVMEPMFMGQSSLQLMVMIIQLGPIKMGPSARKTLHQQASIPTTNLNKEQITKNHTEETLTAASI